MENCFEESVSLLSEFEQEAASELSNYHSYE